MSSSRTVVVAASKFTGFGSSDITFQPVSAQRVVSSTAWAAVSSSAPRPAAPPRSAARTPPAFSYAETMFAFGSVANRPSPSSAAIREASPPPEATGIRIGCSGRSKTLASSSLR